MATWTGLSQTPAIVGANHDWKQRCMLANGSVLSDKSLWTKDNVDTLKKLFVDNPILGEADRLDRRATVVSSIICFKGGEELNRWMAANGWAVAYREVLAKLHGR